VEEKRMTKYRTRARLFVAAATLLLAGAAAPVFAQAGPSDFDAPGVNCGSFQRWGHGGWTVTSPTTMNIDNGMQISFAPGQSFGPGSTVNGVAIPVILDRHCGNL
jgi:hypothetical protein